MAKYVATNYSKKVVQKGIENMALKELRSVSKSLFNTANKRIDRLKASNMISPAWEGLKRRRSQEHFTSGGKDLKSLQKEVADAIAFLNRETSTVGGAKTFTKHLERVVGDRINDKDYINDVFDLMHGIEERIPVQLASNMIGTNDVLNYVIEEAVQENLSAINSEADSRDDFISKAVEKLVGMVDETVWKGIESLDKDLSEMQHRLF